MFSCEQVLQEIWAFLDGEAGETTVIHIQKHIELCRSCFSRVEFEKLLRVSIQKKTSHCCPEKLKSKIKDIIEKF